MKKWWILAGFLIGHTCYGAGSTFSFLVQTPWGEYEGKQIEEYHFELDDRVIGICKREEKQANCFQHEFLSPGPHQAHVKVVLRSIADKTLGFYNFEIPLVGENGESWIFNPHLALESGSLSGGTQKSIPAQKRPIDQQLDSLAATNLCESQSIPNAFPILHELQKNRRAPAASIWLKSVASSWNKTNLHQCYPESLRNRLPEHLRTDTWQWVTREPQLTETPAQMTWKDVEMLLKARQRRLALFEQIMQVVLVPQDQQQWLAAVREAPWTLSLRQEDGQKQFLSLLLIPSIGHTKWGLEKIKQDTSLHCATPQIQKLLPVIARRIAPYDRLPAVQALIQRTPQKASLAACQAMLP